MAGNEDSIVARIEEDLRQVEERFKEYVRTELYEAHREAIDQRIKPLERLVYGLVGLVMTMVACGVIGLVLVGGN